MTTTSHRTAAAALEQLSTDLDGRLVRPGDPTWDEDRRAWQLAVDQHPAAVVLAASVRDVTLTVAAAAQAGLRVAPQGTGHNAAPLGALDGTVLLKTSALRGVAIDPDRRVARVEAGALWADVTAAAGEHGLAALAGSAPDVGVVGYTLGGGLSWFARSHGLAASSVLAAEIVTADGVLRQVDADHDPDLFWAVRGGGGSFGVVTALEFRLHPIAEVYAGVLFWPLERAAEVLEAWRTWTATVPDAVTSVGRLLRFPPLPDLPPHLAGRAFVVVEAACQLTVEEGERLLAPLRALQPEMDTFATVPTTTLATLHMDPDGPVPAYGDGMLLGELPAEAVAALVRVAGPGTDVPLLSVELRQLGGALAPGASAGGAVAGIDAAFVAFAVGITPDPAAVRAVRSAVEAVQHGLGPWSTGGAYLNFAERLKAGDALFGSAAHRRLREVKRRYDPADVIRANQPVRPA
jgi:hypothetical protein